MCQVSHPSHPHVLDHINYIWQRIQVMKLQVA
jgi:hypothetical protein